MPEPECGAVAFLQRFGSTLNLNPHLHVLVLDGVYTCPALDAPPIFHRLPDPTDTEIAQLLASLRTRLTRRLTRIGILPPPDDDTEAPPLPFDSPALGACYAASLQGRIALGDTAGAPVARLGRDPDAAFAPPAGARLAVQHGFTLHAGVRISGNDRERLERLCRYVARPALATERLTLRDDGTARYRLRRPFPDGTTAVAFEPLTLIEKLAALVPPPRAHLVTYHGVLAPNAAWRDAIVPRVTPSPSLRRRRKRRLDDDAEDPRRYTWAELMKRVFHLDVLTCDRCGKPRRLIALLTDPPVVRAILQCLGLPTEPPPLHPPRWPP